MAIIDDLCFKIINMGETMHCFRIIFLSLFIFTSHLAEAYSPFKISESRMYLTIELSDETPLSYPYFPNLKDLHVTTNNNGMKSKIKHGINYRESFPNLKSVGFFLTALENIDFEFLGELEHLEEFHMYLPLDENQISQFSFLIKLDRIVLNQHFPYPETDQNVINQLQQILPNTKIIINKIPKSEPVQDNPWG